MQHGNSPAVRAEDRRRAAERGQLRIDRLTTEFNVAVREQGEWRLAATRDTLEDATAAAERHLAAGNDVLIEEIDAS